MMLATEDRGMPTTLVRQRHPLRRRRQRHDVESQIVALAATACIATASAGSATARPTVSSSNLFAVGLRHGYAGPAGPAPILPSSPFAFTVAPVAAGRSSWRPYGWRTGLACAVACSSAALAVVGSVRWRKSKRREVAGRGCVTRSGAGQADEFAPDEAGIPQEYKAAGVLFFTREKSSISSQVSRLLPGADGAASQVSRVLLGVEERKVSLRELGSGSGTAKRRVLLFPQGKVEKCDRASFVETARREFIEETGDPGGVLAEHLKEWDSRSDKQLPPSWFAFAKMAVVFCEVPEQHAVESAADAFDSSLPMRAVWVDADDLRRALASPSNAAEVKTDAGLFPLFPMTRRFLQSGDSKRWLGMAPRPRRGGK